MNKTIIKWAILILLATYAVGAAIWARGEAAKNVCLGIDVKIAQVEGVDSLTAHGVLAEINEYPEKIKGVPISQLNTRALEEYLSGLSHFEKVECAITNNGKLNVNVTPMVPELRVFDGKRSYYINKDGKEIESKASFFVDVPLATGNFTKDFTPKNILPLVRYIESDRTLHPLIGMVQVKDPQNILLVPRIQGHVINFGDTSRLQEKRDALLAVYKKVMPYKGWDCYDTISVKFKGQVVASRRDKTPRDHGGIFTEEIDLEESTLPDITADTN